ncbi:MAG: HAD-IC family P-type ATPase, partial [Beijerinckiaceae bacterium]
MNLFRLLRHILIVIPLLGLPAGLLLLWQGHDVWAQRAFAAVALPVLGALLWEIIASLRRGDVGLDIVAALSMTAALLFGENLAAAVVALMYAGGQYLESYADGRARREMTALLARAPRFAQLYDNSALREVPIDAIKPGDRILVRRGDVVPVDGAVASLLAILDQSMLTGESIPVHVPFGQEVMSGAANAGDAFDLVASRPAADSTYAGIVRMVESAQASKAPMARLADRFAIVFLGVTLLIAGLAWVLTGDPIRAVAVLVVATPCPLILAVPVAIAAGLSKAAAGGVLVKGGQVLERLADIRSIVVDKTGTLTHGAVTIRHITPAPGFEASEVLRLAASLDQASPHVVAKNLVKEATARGLCLSMPSDTVETPGEGIAGIVE